MLAARSTLQFPILLRSPDELSAPPKGTGSLPVAAKKQSWPKEYTSVVGAWAMPEDGLVNCSGAA